MLQIKLECFHEGDIIQREPTENSIVIEGEFIFGLLEANMEEEHDIPFCACLIEPSHFIRADN